MLSLFLLTSVVQGYETGLILSEMDEALIDMDEMMVQGMHLHVRAGDDSVDIPAELNWAAKGKMNTVKSQGGCGSCWAFAAADALSSRYAIKNGIAVPDISEKHMLDCTFEDSYDGCGGGWSDDAWRNVALDGVAGQNNYRAYNQKDEACPTKAEFKASGYTKAAYAGADGGDTTVHEYFGAAADLRELKEDITIYGPCVMYMGADAAFMSLTNGIWRCNPNQGLNHAITVVGWGQENGENYWTIKNSWGTGWGDNGFARISMDHCTLGSRTGVVMKCPEARRAPTEVAKSSCSETAISLGTDPDNAEECVELARTTPGCGDRVMFSEGYKKSWGCYCCKDTDKGFNDHNIWNTYTRAKMTKLPGRGCSSGNANLGTEHKTPESCMAEALETPGCGPTIMWSPSYGYSWGCRCCAADESHFGENQYWDTYIAGAAECYDSSRWSGKCPFCVSYWGWCGDGPEYCNTGTNCKTDVQGGVAGVLPLNTTRRMEVEEMEPPVAPADLRLLKTFEN